MEITYKKMTEAELGTFIKMRITQLTEEYTSEGKIPPEVDLEAALWDFYHRHMGIAKELLHRVVEEARAYGCGAVQITASDMGVKLYTAYGFTHNGKFMQYKL